MTHMKIGLFSDHGGFELKENVKQYFNKTYNLYDVGTYTKDSVDYPFFGHLAAHHLKTKEIDRAILFCGSGIGICISANRSPWVRGFVAHNKNEVILARLHNDVNVISLSGRTQSLQDVIPLIESFLVSPFEGGRHKKRVEQLSVPFYDIKN